MSASSTTNPAHIFDEDSVARALSTTQGYAGRNLLGLREETRSEPPYQSKQQESGPTGRHCSTAAKALIEEARTDHHGTCSSEQEPQSSVAQETGEYTTVFTAWVL